MGDLPRRRLIGAKAILRYLSERHSLVICRETLHRLRSAPRREFSCSDVAAVATPFPASGSFDGLRVTVTADPEEVDAWVARHRRYRGAD